MTQLKLPRLCSRWYTRRSKSQTWEQSSPLSSRPVPQLTSQSCLTPWNVRCDGMKHILTPLDGNYVLTTLWLLLIAGTDLLSAGELHVQ